MAGLLERKIITESDRTILFQGVSKVFLFQGAGMDHGVGQVHRVGPDHGVSLVCWAGMSCGVGMVVGGIAFKAAFKALNPITPCSYGVKYFI